MTKAHEEKLLFDTVASLEHESKLEGVGVVIKMMVERTLALLRKPTDFLEEIPFVMPPIDVFQSFHLLDQEIRKFIQVKDYRGAHDLLIEYIDLLPLFSASSNTDQLRDFISSYLLDHSEQATKKKVEVYTSSKAAELVGVTDQTIRRWCNKGKYPEAYQTEGGHWRIPQKYFKISLEQARKRMEFEHRLNEYNASKGEADESEWL